MLDALVGDTDPTPIPTLVEWGLRDSSNHVRALSASSFIVYAHSNPKAASTAVPRLIELLENPDRSPCPVAAGAFRAISGPSLGEDPARRRAWGAQTEH